MGQRLIVKPLKKMIKDVFSDFPDLLEDMFCTPYTADFAIMDHHQGVELFMDLKLETFQSLLKEIIMHQKL